MERGPWPKPIKPFMPGRIRFSVSATSHLEREGFAGFKVCGFKGKCLTVKLFRSVSFKNPTKRPWSQQVDARNNEVPCGFNELVETMMKGGLLVEF
jgi:hypothetical protein